MQQFTGLTGSNETGSGKVEWEKRRQSRAENMGLYNNIKDLF